MSISEITEVLEWVNSLGDVIRINETAVVTGVRMPSTVRPGRWVAFVADPEHCGEWVALRTFPTLAQVTAYAQGWCDRRDG